MESPSTANSPDFGSLYAKVPPTADEAEEAGLPSLQDLPKEVGVLLTTVGVLGLLLPGVVGAPALLAGGLVLWPRAFGKAESYFSGRFPATHRRSMKQVGRFLDDLERRYPRDDGPTTTT